MYALLNPVVCINIKLKKGKAAVLILLIQVYYGNGRVVYAADSRK